MGAPKMKITFIVLALAAAVFAFPKEQASWEDDISMASDMAPEENLVAVVEHLRSVSDNRMTYHVNRIAKHARLIQTASFDDADEEKAKAYAHNFAASKAAIRAALKSLTDQLDAGHKHDKNALESAFAVATGAVSKAVEDGKTKTTESKHAACPLKREEEKAEAIKKAKLKNMGDIKGTKICELSTTWEDMDVEKTTPKFGTELRNAWDKKNAAFKAAKAEADAATKAHNKAMRAHESAMASFKTALGLMVDNAHTACKNAHEENEALKKEVASNVATRKKVFKATLVVTCYVDNLSNNAGGKACADKARAADDSQWNITPKTLDPCVGKVHLTNEMGPTNWEPSMANCKGWKPIKPAVVCAAGEKPASEEFGFMQTPMGANSKLFSDASGIYLKGKYIELGIDKKGGGRYGANYSKLPAGFFGRQGGKKKIGMVGDGDGFGVGKDLRIDYFLPGTHEERFQIGYKLSGKEHKAINYDKTFKDTSSGDVASMMPEGTSGPIKTKQEVSLGATDYYFRTKVTVTNVGKQTLQDVRYGRSCDPDNTVDMGGSYTTENHIKSTFAAGDKFASVSATSKSGDKYFKSAGSTSQLVYASVDKRAVPAYGNSGLYPKAGVFSTEVNTPHAKNKKHSKDAWIGMFVKFGDMAPGQTETFYFDTWMAESKVKIDEAAVAKASKSIAKVPTTKGCAAVACPAHSSGPDVRSGCTCSKSGTVTATKSAPFYKSTCSRL